MNTSAHLPDSPPSRGFLVKLRAGADADRFVERFRQSFADPGGAFDAAPQPDPVTIVDYRRVGQRPSAMALVLAALATLTIALALVGSLHRRSRDFAVLRALGFTRADVRAAVLAQAAATVAAVLVIAVPLGLLVGGSFWSALERSVGTSSGRASSTGELLVALSFGFAVLAACLIRPVAMLASSRPSESLRTE